MASHKKTKKPFSSSRRLKKTTRGNAAKRAKATSRGNAAIRTKTGAKPIIADGDAARIIAAVRQIPRGRVCPYGVVAEVAGLPRRARVVGTVLRQTPSSKGLPWFRVINASGRISFPEGSDSYVRQRKLLEAEGVDFVGGRVNLDRYGWPSRERLLDELLWGPQ